MWGSLCDGLPAATFTSSGGTSTWSCSTSAQHTGLLQEGWRNSCVREDQGSGSLGHLYKAQTAAGSQQEPLGTFVKGQMCVVGRFPWSCVEGSPGGRGAGQQGMHRARGDGSTMLYEGSRSSRHGKGGTREMLIGGTSRLQ